MKPKKQMVVLGAHDSKGNKIDLEEMLGRKKKRYLALHYQPKDVARNFSEFLADYKATGAPKPLLDLFEDAVVLLTYAAEKLPVVPPPSKDKLEKNEEVS